MDLHMNHCVNIIVAIALIESNNDLKLIATNATITLQVIKTYKIKKKERKKERKKKRKKEKKKKRKKEREKKKERKLQ